MWEAQYCFVMLDSGICPKLLVNQAAVRGTSRAVPSAVLFSFDVLGWMKYVRV